MTISSASQRDALFAPNPIISLLDESRRFNLAESTSRDLHFGELLDLIPEQQVRDIRLGYGQLAGSPALLEVVARRCAVDPSTVVTTTGGALGLTLLAFVTCRPGDRAIVATPCFPPTLDMLLALGIQVDRLALSFDAGYRLDLEHLSKLLTPWTRLVSIASPQNPSGVTVSEAEVVELLDIIERKSPGAHLFIDETYLDATYGDDGLRRSFASLHDRVITGSSVSKAHGAPALRVGWLTIPDPELRQQIELAKTNFVISGSPLCEALALALLTNPAAVLKPRQALLATGLRMVEDWLEREPRLEWVRPDAGALCCIRFRSDVDDETVERFWSGLAEHELLLACGDWFGESRRVFRLGFGYLDLDQLAPGLDSISRALDRASNEYRSELHEGRRTAAAVGRLTNKPRIPVSLPNLPIQE